LSARLPTPQTPLQALDLLPEPVLIVSAHGDVLAANNAARAMYEPIIHRDPSGLSLAALTQTEPTQLARYLHGWSRSSAMTPACLELRDPSGRVLRYEVDGGALAGTGSPPSILIRFRREQLFVKRFVELTQRINALSAALATTRMSHQRSERRQRKLEQDNKRLHELASRDALTQLANRRNFDTQIARDWNAAHKAGTWLALVMIDVDHFKHYNDTYGHQAGDRCLRHVADAIVSKLRSDTDTAARYGGEEFALILPETDIAEARSVAERILQAVRELKLPHAGLARRGTVSVSAGVSACVPQSGDDVHELLNDADLALYHAKTEGRDRIGVATGMRSAEPQAYGRRA